MTPDSSPLIWRPFTQMETAMPPIKAVSAKGSVIQTQGGQKLIDTISSWWVITHGHCDDDITQAVQLQTQQLDQVLFANMTHSPAEELVQELSELLPSKLNTFFFSDNGSTAVEVALKAALQYWQHQGESQRKSFISFEHSYHGDTVGAMSVSAESSFTEPYRDLLFQVYRVQQGQLSTDSIEKYTAHFKEVLLQHHEFIAGVILEPLVQGAGGMIMWPPEAIQEILELCAQYGVLTIFDEVMTGFGRTGSLFAFEQFPLKPDFLCLSKGLTGGFLPLSLTITTREIYSAFLSKEKSKMFFHGHSFTANPLSCAAALASVKKFKTKKLDQKWIEMESLHREHLPLLQEKYLDARVCGTIAAIELDDPNPGYSSQLSDKFFTYALERGVFLRPLGNVVYLLPPYSTTPEQLIQTWEVIASGIKKLI